MLHVRPAVAEDVADIVRVHMSAFPGFFLTMLGPRFLRRLYCGFVDERQLGVLLVAQEAESTICGLLAGSRAPERFFRTIRRRQGVAMVVVALPAAMRHPLRVIGRLLAAVYYRGDQPADLPGYWLLSSLGVEKGRGGSGIGEALVSQFCDLAGAAHARGIYLVTDDDDNDRAQRFYCKCGFDIHSRRVRGDGRRMAVMTRRLDHG